MKLAIGSVQFGMNYGLTQDGRPSLREVEQILEEAARSTIDCIDTAPVYGEAESILGACHAVRSFRIISKIPPVPSGTPPDVFIKKTVRQSLSRLRCDRLFALLLHRASDWCLPGVHDCLSELRLTGVVHKIGISVYFWNEIVTTLKLARPDIIQLPINVLDQRLVSELGKLKELRIEIHARSIFLQGLLLLPIEKTPHFFEPILPSIIAWKKFMVEHGFQPEEGALSFIGSLNEIDCAIVGIHSANQLSQIVRAFQGLGKCSRQDFRRFAVRDLKCIIPMYWPGLTLAG